MDDDIYHYGKKLENQLRLLAAESFPDEKKELIMRYARMLEARGLNKGRIAKAVFLLRAAALTYAIADDSLTA